jgi:hypothetical protein
MEEKIPDPACISLKGCAGSILQAAKMTFHTGRWIVSTPFAFVVILAALVFDNVNRMTVTLISQYFRMIQIPEALFGVIQSLLALLGLFIPGIALKMVNANSPFKNLVYLSIITWAGLFGISLFVPYVGLLPVVLVFSSMMMMQFFQSHYLNRITPSRQRATVLSFKGLSMNLAYGMTGILFSLLVEWFRGDLQNRFSLPPGNQLEDLVFSKSVSVFHWYFLAALLVMVLYAARRLKSVHDHKMAG